MRRLRLRSVCDIAPGLIDPEFDRIEREFCFQFADDHRAFLSAGLPVHTRPRRREPDAHVAWTGEPAARRDALRTTGPAG